MANSAGIATSFKMEILDGIHALGTSVVRAATTADTLKAALYITTASPAISPATAAYTATGEVSGTNYTAGGITVTNATVPATSGTGAIWTPSASFAWTNVTLSTAFDTVLIYNSTQGNKAIEVCTFGAQTVTAGNFTLTMPVNATGTALIQVT